MVIFEQLPEDVSEMILLRLPVKSLLRFKCVSKSWCASIRDPRFIDKHITFNSDRNLLFMSHLNALANSQVLSFLSYETFQVAGSLVHNLYKIQGKIHYVQILGLCNGVFCIFDGIDTIALWNPAIKELRVLPPSDVIPPPNAGTLDTCVGFGYDRESRDYKVLVFKHMCSNSTNSMAHAELYAMRSDSWKFIVVEDGFQPLGNLPISAFNPSINGVFSWFEIDDNVEKVIFSFDMSKEAFTKTHLPDYGIPSTRVHGKLVSLKNSLCFIHDYPLGETSKGFDVWVLGEHGVNESWKKYLSIGPLVGVEVPLGFSKSDGLLFENKGEFIYCDRITQTMKKLNICGAKKTLRVFRYQESLVSVKRANEVVGGTSYRQGSRFNFEPFIQLELNANVL